MADKADRSDYHRRYEQEKRDDARDIGPPPECVNRERRARGRDDLASFLKEYFPQAFPLSWSKDHLRIIEALQVAITEGGLFAMAMPRGSGKTTMSVRAALYAMLYGYRQFVSLIGASEPAAKSLLRTVQDELRFNDLLAEDFPEACHSLRALEGEPRRCKGQSINGIRTDTLWTAQQVRFPNIPAEFESHCRGAVVSVAGITGAIRGQQMTRYDGAVLRPNFVILDDPQTRESAYSETQCRFREQVVSGDVLGMAGPGVKVSAVMPCTVIRQDDLADRLLNRKTHPDWNGVKTKLVYSFPENEKLWDEYRLIRAEGMAAGDRGKGATDYYAANQEAMDEGSVCAWEQRHNPDELSAIQHAMNLRFRDESAFFAEYQNEPVDERPDDSDLQSSDEICARVNKVNRGVVPLWATHLTGFIDVQQSMLFWTVCAWSDDFTGAVVDCGSWPDQGRNYFTLSGATKTIQSVLGDRSLESQLYDALNVLLADLHGREWPRDGTGGMRISRMLVDAGYQTNVVHQVVRESQWANVLYPSHGRYVGATNKPFWEYERRAGERAGLMWRIGTRQEGRQRYCVFDSNWWKTFVHRRLQVDLGARSNLTLFGNRPQVHQMLSDHLLAEECIRVEAKGRTVDEWRLKQGRPDNHWLDCLVGSAVAASIDGCTLGEVRPIGKSNGDRPSLGQLARKKKPQ